MHSPADSTRFSVQGVTRKKTSQTVKVAQGLSPWHTCHILNMEPGNMTYLFDIDNYYIDSNMNLEMYGNVMIYTKHMPIMKLPTTY